VPIFASKKETDYSAAPEGLWPAVCVDVVDLGIVKTPFGDQVKIQIRWQLEERDPKTGKRYLIVQSYTPSLHEKSRLRPMLEAWRGRKFNKDEEKQFDVEKLLGANCQLQVIHNIKNEGQIYANVQAVVPAGKGSVKLRPDDYIRMVDRAKQEGQQHGDTNGAVNGDDWVPF
jgi:hypothetical protein